MPEAGADRAASRADVDRSSADRATPMPSHGRSALLRALSDRMRTSPRLDGAYARLQGLATFVAGPSYPLRRGELVRPFFIVGSGRSGNTLLRRVLQASDQVHVPPETYALQTAISLFRRQRLPWPHLVRLVLAQFEYHPDFDDFNVSLRPLANRLASLPEQQRSLAAVLDAFYRYHGRQTGQAFERWGDKTPLNCYALERIVQVFPDAQVIHLLRDGADVVHSYLASGLITDVDSAARRWTTSVAAARRFAARHPDSCLEVRYERLVTSPTAAVAAICDFLAIPFDASMLVADDHVPAMGDLQRHRYYAGVTDPITPRSVGKGRAALDQAQRRRVQALAGGALADLGYPPLV